MRYGISISPAGPGGDPASMAELAAAAEKAGWDGIFLEDYIVYQGQVGTPTYDPWVTMAAMTVATSRVRLGTSVTPLPRRRPWQLASEAVTLDHLSQGRLILGVGSGDTQDPGFTATGEPLRRAIRAELLDESLEIVTRLWTGEPVTFRGRHFKLDGLRMSPRPVQQPRIPVWIGGQWTLSGVRARVTRWDGSCAYKGPTDQEWQDMTAADVRDIRAAVGDRPGFDIAIGGRQRDADWDREREHVRTIASAGATWWVEWVKPGDRQATIDAVRRGPLRAD
ncbi:MAG TPA: LLM class flavin-dependent oxidoreductase [Streptosporangiaceae bacterium]|nr:LLM class flavin-dependent oxidoreductase [Streptosporangiaceae bacterium]